MLNQFLNCDFDYDLFDEDDCLNYDLFDEDDEDDHVEDDDH